MTIQISNVNPGANGDTFGDFINKVNQALDVISTKAVTTDSNTATGNAAISGMFTANTLSANSANVNSFTANNVAITRNVTANNATFTNNVAAAHINVSNNIIAVNNVSANNIVAANTVTGKELRANVVIVENHYSNTTYVGALISNNYGSFSGNVTAPRFIANVAQGSAPFVVTSNTMVANLNANFLNGKADTFFANTTHTHSSSGITDFNEAVDDRVAALIVAGNNVIVTYEDANNVLRISTSANITTSAESTTFTPTGDIAATNVQSAIVELDQEKVARNLGSFTGNVIIQTTYDANISSNEVAFRNGEVYLKSIHVSNNGHGPKVSFESDANNIVEIIGAQDEFIFTASSTGTLPELTVRNKTNTAISETVYHSGNLTRETIGAIGNIFQTNVITSNTTFNFHVDTKWVEVILIGGGGAGGGANASANAVGAAPGGNAGSVLHFIYEKDPIVSQATITIGLGGVGVSAGAGGDGSNTVFTQAGIGDWISATAPGGKGGPYAGPAALFLYRMPNSTSLSPNNPITIPGALFSGETPIGSPGHSVGDGINGTIASGISGKGADTDFGYGRGGRAVQVYSASANVNAGEAATGYGAGGSGAIVSKSTSARAGGTGAPGLAIIKQYR